MQRDYFHTETVVKKIAGGSIDTVAVSTTMFRKCISDLLLNKRRDIELWSPSSSSASSSATSHRWFLNKRATAGDLSAFADELEHATLANDNCALLEQLGYSSCICTGKPSTSKLVCPVGVAHINTRTRKIGIATFEDDQWFSHLEAFLAGMDGTNCIIAPNAANKDRIKGVVARAGLTLNTKSDAGWFFAKSSSNGTHKKAKLTGSSAVRNYAHTDDIGVVRKLVKPGSHGFASLSHVGTGDSSLGDGLGMRSAASLVRCLKLEERADSWGTYTLEHIDVTAHLELGSGALRALQVFPVETQSGGKSAASSNHAESLFQVLNECSTPMGTRCLRQWFLAPPRDVQTIHGRLDVVEYFVKNPQQRLRCQQLLKSTSRQMAFPDVEQILLRVLRGKGSLNDLLSLYRSSLIASDIISYTNSADVIVVVDSDPDLDVNSDVDTPSHTSAESRPQALLDLFGSIKNTLNSLSSFCDSVKESLDAHALTEFGICVLDTTQWPELDRLQSSMLALDKDIVCVRDEVAKKLE